MDLKSLKLFHEVLGFNHRTEPDRYEYFIDYNLISKTRDARNIQKIISQEVERIASRMQGFVFRVDKKKMHEITGERNVASVSPFDRIVYQGSQVKIVLGRTFKKLLVRYQQFYLGDARTVRRLNHKASIHMYWLIISHSWKGHSFEVTLEELKRLLGCPGAYENRWDNFRKFILDPIQKEFKNTWAKFEYTTKRKGRRINSLTFTFESDAQVIRNIINESPYKFEHQLHLYQMKHNAVIHIRDQVRKGVYTEQDVENVILHAQSEKKIKSKAGFIIKALKDGWYERMAIQTELQIPVTTVVKPTPTPKNGYWGEIQAYWNFSDEQINELRQVYNENTLKKAHYQKSTFFTEETNTEIVFDSFMESVSRYS
ncbi:replication initiation protein [Tunicatimonas pelagia]|uniref:replication initiation protein n=1 Tax=Tunicatimonas pelagia TaxID=931531 RepID=UPI002665EBEE|nr:replication initiation protein [Tunicatimonas pelagia]WKN46490.1 replication initiation protein [Tunicatimonas pelagia]